MSEDELEKDNWQLRELLRHMLEAGCGREQPDGSIICHYCYAYLEHEDHHYYCPWPEAKKMLGEEEDSPPPY